MSLKTDLLAAFPNVEDAAHASDLYIIPKDETQLKQIAEWLRARGKSEGHRFGYFRDQVSGKISIEIPFENY